MHLTTSQTNSKGIELDLTFKRNIRD